jgi:transposase-like protein
MRRFEAAHDGRPIEEVVTEALNAHGSINAAARALSLNNNTLYFWVMRLGIRIRTVAEMPSVAS